MAKGTSKKQDFTEYKTPICKTSWVSVFKGNKKDIAKIVKAGGDVAKFRRKCSFMLPKSVEVIDLAISDKGKKKLVADGKQFLKEFKAAALKMALSVYDDCDSKEDLEESGIRWNPVLDGDKKKLAKHPGNPGYWIIRAGTGLDYSSKDSSPFIYNPGKERVYETGVFRSGDWVKGFLTLFDYAVDGNEGITAGMNDIWKCYTGKFTGITTANYDDDDEELEELEETAEDFEDTDADVDEEDEDEDWG